MKKVCNNNQIFIYKYLLKNFLLRVILLLFIFYYKVDPKNMENLSLNEELENFFKDKNQKKLLDYINSEPEGPEK